MEAPVGESIPPWDYCDSRSSYGTLVKDLNWRITTMTRHDSDIISHIHQELHSHLPSEPALRLKALESLLVEKAMVDPKTVDAWVEVYSDEIGPKRGAQVVARASRSSRRDCLRM